MKRDILLSFLSALLLILSFPNFNRWLFAWFGFVPLFFAVENKSPSKAFLLSYLIGLIFWFGVIYWLVHVTVVGLILLVLYLALYFGIFGLIVLTMNHELSTMNLLLIPSLWVILEYIRSHLFTGFPWALLGYSQYLNLPAIQFADITGVWGVSFLVMMVNVMIKEIISSKFKVQSSPQKIIYKFLFVTCSIFLMVSGYGIYKLYHRPSTNGQRQVKISVIQGNIPQELKWDIQARDFIIDKYFTLTAAAAGENPDLIIWPEAALPVTLEEEPLYYQRVVNYVKDIRLPLLLGAVTAKEAAYYNSALFLSGEGQLLNKYNKLHLVPFGEYIPLRKILPFLATVVPIGDFTAGKEYTIFKSQSHKVTKSPANFSVLICFEDLFPQISRQSVNKGADFLVNITNDAWFKKTSSPYQHLQASVFRAVENRRSLVRSANTGISGFIGPSGQIISLVEDKAGRNMFIDGYKTGEMVIPERRQLSFYTRYGDVFIMACFLFLFYGIIRHLKTQNLKRKAQD